jgi:hypothetical protein
MWLFLAGVGATILLVIVIRVTRANTEVRLSWERSTAGLTLTPTKKLVLRILRMRLRSRTGLTDVQLEVPFRAIAVMVELSEDEEWELIQQAPDWADRVLDRAMENLRRAQDPSDRLGQDVRRALDDQ